MALPEGIQFQLTERSNYPRPECPECGQVQAADWQKCTNCGALRGGLLKASRATDVTVKVEDFKPVPNMCPHCGMRQKPGDAECPVCGYEPSSMIHKVLGFITRFVLWGPLAAGVGFALLSALSVAGAAALIPVLRLWRRVSGYWRCPGSADNFGLGCQIHYSKYLSSISIPWWINIARSSSAEFTLR